MTFSELLNSYFKFIVIKTNNYCNLSCQYCNNLCDTKISYDSSNIHRQVVYNINPVDLIKYCTVMGNVGLSDSHRLSGGEPTLLKNDLLATIVETLHSNGRYVELMTNGFGIFNLDKSVLHMISKITFDNHNTNISLIDECKKYLRSFFTGEIKVINQQYHYNLIEAQSFECNKGQLCDNWLSTLTLYKKVIFPCCVTYPLMLYRNDTELYTSLYNAGWCIDNPELIDTMQHYKTTIPQIVIDECLYNCWNPHFSLATKVLIQ